MTRNERTWAAVLVRLCSAPQHHRSDACDAVWRAVLSTGERAELESIALQLFSIDGVARRVPGDVHNRIWRRCKVQPCAECGRAPCDVVCARRTYPAGN